MQMAVSFDLASLTHSPLEGVSAAGPGLPRGTNSHSTKKGPKTPNCGARGPRRFGLRRDSAAGKAPVSRASWRGRHEAEMWQ